MSSKEQPLRRAPGLILKLDTPKGRGVFASEAIPKGTVVDVSPVLVFGEEDEKEGLLRKTCLAHYTYNWPVPPSSSPASPNPNTHPSSQPLSSSSPSSSPAPSRTHQTQALALGLGSLFNHSSHPHRLNVTWSCDVPRQSIVYTTHRDIVAGEELCISYGGRLWFVDTDAVGGGGEDNEGGKEREEGEGDELRRSGLGSIFVDGDEGGVGAGVEEDG